MANSLLIGRESIIPIIIKGNKDYNDQEDINTNNNRVHQIKQQLEGGVETEAARPKVSYMAVACSSYAPMQPTPPEPHLKALYKIKIP